MSSHSLKRTASLAALCVAFTVGCTDPSDEEVGHGRFHVETSPESFRAAGVLAAGETHSFVARIPDRAGPVVVELAGAGDAQLYTALDGAPTADDFDCHSDLTGEQDATTVCTHPAHDGLVYIQLTGESEETNYEVETNWGISTSP